MNYQKTQYELSLITDHEVIVDEDGLVWIGDTSAGSAEGMTCADVQRAIEREDDRIEESKFWASPRGRRIENDLVTA